MNEARTDFDVAVIGAGPAGLSAALILGRCRRRVIIIDHGKPRNYAAHAVNGYLGLDGASPAMFRLLGKKQVEAVGGVFKQGQVNRVTHVPGPPKRFAIEVDGGSSVSAKKLLLATGVVDRLPAIEQITTFYGTSVHHCPYCDGLEHAGQQLVALGSGRSAVGLALSLRGWSERVVACSNGVALSCDEQQPLIRNGIAYRPQRVLRLSGDAGQLRQIVFAEGPNLDCDALFFTSSQGQRSELAKQLGCACDETGCIRTGHKESTGVRGLFVAGDANGDVQFAIVAAAEGATAATAIHRELQDEEFGTLSL